MTLHEQDLQQLLLTKRPSVLALTVIMREVCRLVDAMHNHGFAHNDLCMSKVSVSIPNINHTRQNGEERNGEKVREISRKEDLDTKVMLLGVRFMRPLGNKAYVKKIWETWKQREMIRVKRYPWLAPELFTYCRNSTKAADVYSIGYMGRQLLQSHSHSLTSILRKCKGPEATRPSVSQLFYAFDKEVTIWTKFIKEYGENNYPS